LKAQNRPPIVLELEKKYNRQLKNGGTIYVGQRGIMYTGNYAGSPRIIPEDQHRATPVPEKTLPRIKGTHQDDFLRAVRGGEPACSDFSYAAALTEMVLLGCLAIKAGPGRRVVWAAGTMRCPDLRDLGQWIRSESRPGWTLE